MGEPIGLKVWVFTDGCIRDYGLCHVFLSDCLGAYVPVY